MRFRELEEQAKKELQDEMIFQKKELLKERLRNQRRKSACSTEKTISRIFLIETLMKTENKITPSQCQIIADGRSRLILPGQGIIVVDNPMVRNFVVSSDYHQILIIVSLSPVREILFDREFQLKFIYDNIDRDKDCNLFNLDFFAI
jgi:hypothetical protein